MSRQAQTVVLAALIFLGGYMGAQVTSTVYHHALPPDWAAFLCRTAVAWAWALYCGIRGGYALIAIRGEEE